MSLADVASDLCERKTMLLDYCASRPDDIQSLPLKFRHVHVFDRLVGFCLKVVQIVFVDHSKKPSKGRMRLADCSLRARK